MLCVLDLATRELHIATDTFGVGRCGLIVPRPCVEASLAELHERADYTCEYCFDLVSVT